jgi:hypothetical protein
MRAAASWRRISASSLTARKRRCGLKMMARFTALPASGAPTPGVYY